MSPAPRHPRVKKVAHPATKPVKQPVASAATSFTAPAGSESTAKPLDYTAPRVNLLDTGLSDYSFWVAHVESLKPEPLPKGTRTGRIWA